jgi:histidinol-phosphatase
LALLDDSWLDHALLRAREAADAAAKVIARYHRKNIEVERKFDASPVTVADRESEREIKRVLKCYFPDHGYYGEEYGQEQTNSEFLWLIDPIDGTKSFVRDCPFYSTQIALQYQGELVLGVSSAPQYGEVAWARAGGGAYLNHERLSVSSMTCLDRAHLSLGNIQTLASDHRWSALSQLVRSVDRVRGYGDFCHYHLLARGCIDAVIESDVNILDIAALVVLVREAGGIFSDLEGRPIGLETKSVIAAAPGLYDELRATMNLKVPSVR